MNQRIPTQLLEQLHSLSYHAFEGCLCDLLNAMGYEEVTLLGRTQTRQYTPHGGRDLEASARTGVTHARLVLQAKQYYRPVSRRFVDELRGTVLRLGARQGLLITTSTFSHVARRAAHTSVAPIQLLDGQALVRLLIQHQIGVTTPAPQARQDLQGMRLDTDYFASLQERFPHLPKTETLPPPRPSLPPVVSPPASVAVREITLTQPIQGGTVLWRTHVFAGVNTLWLFPNISGALTSETFPLLALLAAFGALLPDIDASASKIRSLSLGGIRPLAPVSMLAHRTFGHRGFLHSPKALALLGLLLTPSVFWWGIGPPLALWTGYASHLLLDACTPYGIPRYRNSAYRLHLLPPALRLRTGSEAEGRLQTLLAVAALALALSQLYALRMH